MKRLLLTSIVVSLCSIGFAQKVKIDKIEYKIENGEAYVYESDKDIEVANILSSVEYQGKSYPVTKIGRSGSWGLNGHAFYNRKKLMSVSIPNSVITIDISSFLGCENLQEISIPNSVKTIGAWAFSCIPIEKMIVPDSPMNIFEGTKAGQEAGAFWGCKNITEVRCQNGSFPRYMLTHLPADCPFMIGLKYQQPVNNGNVYAQNPQPQPVQPSPQPEKKKPSSDVDVNLPSNATTNDKTFAVIFANEDYQEEVKVDYALNDGEMFKEYCHKVLGMPEDNIHFRKNATKNNMIAEISWMKKVADAYGGQAKFIVFYAGHGIPDEKTGSAYLLPVDGIGTEPETAYSLASFYKTLGALPVANVTVFMDACFSGSKRGEGMLASARGVAIKAKTQAPQGKMVVFSAAQGDETAYPFKEKEHGLFTYYLLKKLQETKGNVTYGELSTYLQTEVKRKSIVANSKSQTPTVNPSQSVANSWKNMKLK